MRAKDAQKKQAELAAVRAMLTRVFGYPDDVEAHSREGPDVMAVLPDLGAVGIEVTQPMNAAVRAGIAGLERLCGELESNLRSDGWKVAVRLRATNQRIAELNDGAQTRAHRDALLKLIREHQAAPDSPERYRTADLRRRGIECLADVWIQPADAPTVEPRVGSTEFDGSIAAAVQQALDDKGPKLGAYRRDVGAIPLWILIVAGGSFASGTMSRVVRQATYATRFERAFYIDEYDGEAFELSLTTD